MLIVPNRADVDRVERELLARRPALLGGSIGTFDDLFERLAMGSENRRRRLGRVEQTLLVRRVVSGAELNGYTRSAAHAGFVHSLERALGATSRSSPTASKTSPAGGGRCSRPWPRVPRSPSRCPTGPDDRSSRRYGKRPRISPVSPRAPSRSCRLATGTSRLRLLRTSSG